MNWRYVLAAAGIIAAFGAVMIFGTVRSQQPQYRSVLQLNPTDVSIRISQPALEQAKVVRIVDGDTVELADGRKVRYIGINSPETVDTRKPVECFGKEAKEANRQLAEGKNVFLERDVSETDTYGRLLRYVYTNGTMVNEELVRTGFANAATYPPDVRYSQRFINAEKDARLKKLGLWSACPITPHKSN